MHPSPSRPAEAHAPVRATRLLRPRPGAGILWIWSVFGLCAIVPAGAVVVDAIRGFTGNPEAATEALLALRWSTLTTSAIHAGAIAALALALAWPAACAARHAPRRWVLALATPMLLPAFLAHAGWSLLRAPTTPIGRWIGAAPERGLEWLPLAVGRSLAVWGLALWAWPLAALVIAIGLRSLGSEVADSLRLERCPAWRRNLFLARAVWPSIAMAFTLVALLMLGSAVPLHLARVETGAIRVWAMLDEHPAEPWIAWIAAWPLVALALCAGWLLASPLARLGRALSALSLGDAPAGRVGRLSGALGALPWALAIVAPLALFLWSLGWSARPLVRFVRDAHEGLLSSTAIALCVGALGATLAIGASHAVATSGDGTRRTRPLLALALAAALLPGVLVGSAVAQMTRLPGVPHAIGDGPMPVVLAHLARFAFLPLLVGTWLGATEAASIGGLRRVDGADSLADWARTALAPQAGPILAVALATACLSFHEIEASIQVQPPGLDHLAQRLLQWLHYERMTELSAAAAFLLAFGILAAATIVLSAGRSRTPGGVYR